MRLPSGRRTALAPAVVAGLFAALVVGAPPSSAATTDQSYWTPVDHVLTVSGHGYGHGHGMSQYGAQGAALKGLTATQILAFYYPGTATGTFTGTVRVLISRDTDANVIVAPRAGLTLRDLGSQTTYVLPSIAGVTSWRLRVSAGQELVDYHTDRWHVWYAGGNARLTGDGEFSAGGPVTLRTTTGSTPYRGTLRLASAAGGGHDTVNVVSMDDYVRGVISREMPASWQPAAVQAQAVAARTYAANAIASHASRDWQICDTSSCQVYGGVAAEDSRANAAVSATAGRILTYRGQAAFTQFSASDGGWTSAGSVPYLAATADPYDGWSGNGVHSWSTSIDTRVLERRYPAIGTLQRIRVTTRDGHGDWGGRVGTVVLDGSKADVTVSGDTLRSIYGLKSSWFTFAPTRIMVRWAAIGGATSRIGVPLSREVAVTGGLMQQFRFGQVYFGPKIGGRELYGGVMTAYLALGGPDSALGLPTRATRPEKGGAWSAFEHGEIHYSTAGGARIVRS